MFTLEIMVNSINNSRVMSRVMDYMSVKFPECPGVKEMQHYKIIN